MCKMCHRDVQEVSQQAHKPKPVMFNQLRGLKIKHNLVTDPASDSMQKQVAYQPDLLAVSTQLSREAYDVAKAVFVKLQKTNAYAVITRTTQPFHLVLALLVMCSYFVTRQDTSEIGSLRLWKALYAGGVAIHLGAQFWMTFISGIVLYFSLPRHDFGRVQEVLFPIFYAFSGLVSFITLLSYLKLQSVTNFHATSWLQIALVLTSLLIEATIRLYFVKPMLKMKHLKTQMEEAAHGGQEVGKLVLGELAHCPHYMKILKCFRAHHSRIAIGNMLIFGCSVYSLMILADSICV